LVRVIVRTFVGSCWGSATLFDDFEFDVLPREGEMLTILRGGQWLVARVSAIAHRTMGHGAADIAMLVSRVRESPCGYELLPFTALDEEGVSASTRPFSNPSLWEC
jgi:hypothetical protein